MCRAFLTGSRVYGTLRSGSDIDLVAMADPETIERLSEWAETGTVGSGADDAAITASLRFGRLNLIPAAFPEDYAAWREGTDALAARKPVTRAQAVDEFKERFNRALAQRNSRAVEGEILRHQALEVGVVGIKLYDLVGVAAARKLWPPDFEALVGPLEQDPTDLSRYGVIADWCGENDEPELALAFRWVFKRLGTRVTVTIPQETWSVEHLPPAVTAHMSGWNEAKSIPALMAQIYRAIEAARKDLD